MVINYTVQYVLTYLQNIYKFIGIQKYKLEIIILFISLSYKIRVIKDLKEIAEKKRKKCILEAQIFIINKITNVSTICVCLKPIFHCSILNYVSLY